MITEETSQKIRNMGFLCAMFVVIIHIGLPENIESSTWLLAQLLPQGIARIAVPFFFVVSGYFLGAHIGEPRWWKRENIKRVHSLLIPFYVCTMIYLLILTPLKIYVDIVAHRPFGTSIFYLHKAYWLDETTRFQLTNLDLTKFPYVGSLWYIRNLILLVFVSPIIDVLVRRLKYCWIAICFAWVLLFKLLSLDPENRFLSCGFSLYGLFYFSVGMFIVHKKTVQSTRLVGIVCSLIGLSLLVAKAACVYFNSHPYYTHLFLNISIPFLMVAIWHFMPVAKWPVWLTSCSFAIYLLHLLFFGYIDLFDEHFLNLNPLFPTKAIIKFIIGFFGSIFLTLGIRRFMPRFSKVIFGGR